MTLPPNARLNLTDVARQLADQPKYRDVVDAIARCASAHAALSDLTQAERLLAEHLALAGSMLKFGEQDSSKAEAAGTFFKMATILYARATTDQSGARRKLKFEGALSANDVPLHRSLIALRNKAIAHEDRTDGFPDGPWSNDDLVVDVWTDKLSISYFHRRVNYRKNLVEDLEKALPIARSVLETMRDQLSQELLKILYGDLQNDANFMDRLSEHEWSADARGRWTVQEPPKSRS